MNSFTLTAVGHMARNPEVVAKGDGACTRFCLIGNDYAGKDDEGMAREVTTSLWFSAFGALGDAIAQHARKGDQLIVEARVRPNNWTDKQGEKQYDLTFIVQGFKFGAPGKVKREELSNRREQALGLPRTEELGSGHDPHPAEVLNGAGGGPEAGFDDGAGEVNGHEEPASDRPTVAPGYGAGGSSAAEARSAMEVRESSSAGPVSAPVAAKVTQQTKASPEAKGAQEVKAGQEAKSIQGKARGRSTRKTAGSAA
jgi:single-strand DNA-binding protein